MGVLGPATPQTGHWYEIGQDGYVRDIGILGGIGLSDSRQRIVIIVRTRDKV